MVNSSRKKRTSTCVEASSAGCSLLSDGRTSFFGSEVAAAYDHLMREVAYETWWPLVEDAADFHGVGKVASILDLGCGTGTFAQLAASQGVDVVAVDASPWMLGEARRKLCAESRPRRVSLVRARLPHLPLRHRFDVAVAFFDTFNYILSPLELRTALRSALRCLRPGGLLLFDMNGKTAYEQRQFNREGERPEAGLRFRCSGVFCNRHATYSHRLVLCLAGGTEVEEIHFQRYYSPQFVLQTLEGLGCEPVSCFRGFSLASPSPGDDRWTFAAAANEMTDRRLGKRSCNRRPKGELLPWVA